LQLSHTTPTFNPVLAVAECRCWRLSRIISRKYILHATKKWFREQPEKLNTDGFEKLVRRWLRCVKQAGKYMEI
jgi:hypothetical protein